MKTKAFQTIIGVSMVCFLALIEAFLPTSSFAEESHNLIIQIENQPPVELQPGDVINLSGGIATGTGLTTIWGHSAMYLGIVDGEKKFLDFTTPKKEHSNKNDLYKGRILNKKEFLTENLSHKEFNVFRLSDSNTKVDQEILAAEAMNIAREGKWTPVNNCSRVVAEVLSMATIATTGTQIDVKTPDGFDIDSGFYQPAAGRVNIKVALNELQKAPLQISGEWRGTYTYDDPERVGEIVEFTMTVNQQGSNISGRITDQEIGSSTFSGTFDVERREINFTKIYDADKPPIEYRGIVSDSHAGGKWKIGDYEGSWQINR